MQGSVVNPSYDYTAFYKEYVRLLEQINAL